MKLERHEIEWLIEELELGNRYFPFPHIAYDILGKLNEMLKGESPMSDDEITLTCIERHLKVALCHFDKMKGFDSDIAQWEAATRTIYEDIKSRLEDITNEQD